ncbi:MAG: molecular chaperone [Rhodothermales bacterium]
MHLADAALARSRAYALFGTLYIKGLTPDLLPTVQALPELSSTLPPLFDADAAAADHHDLFGLNVFPYAGLFLDSAGQGDGSVAAYARRLYHTAGFHVDTRREGADHIGHALAFLAFLTGAEADALENRLTTEAERMRPLQCRFLDSYLLEWLPVFVQAVRRHAHPFYTVLADLTSDLVIDHRAALGCPPDAAPDPFFPPPPTLLDDETTGLKDIAAYLTTAARSGFYLSRNDIRRLSRDERLPHGFGPRALMMTHLLRAAAEFDGFEPVLTGLEKEVQAWRNHYTALTTEGLPVLNDIAGRWLQRLATTEHILARMRTVVVSKKET